MPAIHSALRPAPRWAMRASIPRPPRCERGALPTELNARGTDNLATPAQADHLFEQPHGPRRRWRSSSRRRTRRARQRRRTRRRSGCRRCRARCRSSPIGGPISRPPLRRISERAINPKTSARIAGIAGEAQHDADDAEHDGGNGLAGTARPHLRRRHRHARLEDHPGRRRRTRRGRQRRRGDVAHDRAR